MQKRAIILAGGKGTRLKPYTIVFPKPLVPIGEYPILEIVIRQLVKNGFDHITLTVNHQAELIRAFFGNGEKWGVLIDYSYEEQPLSTMGPLKVIENLPDVFLVMNGDILTDLNFEWFYNSFNNTGLFTILGKYQHDKLEYGVLEVDDKNMLVGFREKPVISHLVSTGIYMVNKEIIKYIPENTPYGFDMLMIDMINRKQNIKIELFDGFWLDIGRPDDYAYAIEKYDDLKHLWSDE